MPGNRAELIRLGVLLPIAVVIGVGFYVFRDRLSGAVGDLQVGDCIDQPAGAETIFEVQRRPCNEPHDGEVFAVVSHDAEAGASYPPEAEFGDMADDECVPLLESYSGLSLRDVYGRELTLDWYLPTEPGWNDGDRLVTCYVFQLGSKLTGSLRAIGASPSPL
ncbi:MAG: septum formation family protein [Chloroflexota bacterium]